MSQMAPSREVISTQKLFKSFVVGDQQVPILNDVTFRVQTGEFAVIFGPSGCGKSTLLHILLGLETPSSGEVQIMGRSIYQLPDDQIADFRKKHIGMVYQQSHWIKSLNVLENVAFPLTLLRVSEEERNEKAHQMIRMMQMEKWELYHPSELSSGQQQRISLARALITNPEIIIADEPTGNLDFEAGMEMMELLKKINLDTGKTVLMVTHELEHIKYADQAVRMLDGQIVEEFDEDAARAFLEDRHRKLSGIGSYETTK